MNRKDKIKLLTAIDEGRVTIKTFRPPRVYVFKQKIDCPEIFVHEGKEYTETECNEFCEKIRKRNNNSIVWNEGKECPKEDMVIKLCYVENNNKESEVGVRKITLNL